MTSTTLIKMNMQMLRIISRNMSKTKKRTTSPPQCALISKVLTTKVDEFCHLFPKLIRWRLLVFYASFYTDSVAKYTPDRARAMADAMLNDFQHDAEEIDLLAICNKYVKEKAKSCSMYPKVLTPTLRAIKSAARRLDMPLRQFELAMDMYTRYISHLEQQVTSESASTSTDNDVSVYELFSADWMATNDQWDSLAQTLYEDIRDITCSPTFTFPSMEQSTKEKIRDMLMFSHATFRCKVKYFSQLKIRIQPCESQSQLTQSRTYSVCLGADLEALRKEYERPAHENFVARQSKVVRRVFKVDSPRRCGCLRRQQVVYKLNREARVVSGGVGVVRGGSGRPKGIPLRWIPELPPIDEDEGETR